jgi:hypothetical protein
MALQDKSCKTRVVAILDSYSQVALRPLHRALSLTLRKVRTDFTEDHEGGVDYLMKTRGRLFSIDLSNATDTLPVDLGLEFLKRLVPTEDVPDIEQFVTDVKSVLVDRVFEFKTRGIRYNTGQPMGAYSSFPLLAMTNHLLVQMARVLAGKPVEDRGYAIVGDDVVISGKTVADHYVKLLELLGVPINHQKVVIGRGTFEFCRRIVRDHQLVSVPSWNVHFQASRSRDPTPIILIYQGYRKRLPDYSRLVSLFARRDLRAMLAIHPEIQIRGEPKSITRIPSDVVAHADRVLSVQDSILAGMFYLESDDPYLKRLSYAKTISSFFSPKNIRKSKKCL